MMFVHQACSSFTQMLRVMKCCPINSVIYVDVDVPRSVTMLGFQRLNTAKTHSSSTDSVERIAGTPSRSPTESFDNRQQHTDINLTPLRPSLANGPSSPRPLPSTPPSQWLPRGCSGLPPACCQLHDQPHQLSGLPSVQPLSRRPLWEGEDMPAPAEPRS